MWRVLRLICAIGATVALFAGAAPGVVIAVGAASESNESLAFRLALLIPTFLMNVDFLLLAVAAAFVVGWWLLCRLVSAEA
jgi:hypothetical protein